MGQTKAAQKSLIHQAIRKSWKIVAAVVIFSLGINLLMLVGPVFMLQVYDRVLTSASTATLIYLIVAAVFLLFASGLLEMFRSRVLVRLSGRLGTELDRITFSRVLEYGLKGGRDRLGVQPIRDVDTIRNFVGGPALTTLFDAPWTPLFLLVIFLMSPVLSLVALVGAAVLFAIAFATERSTNKPLRDAGSLHSQSLTFAEGALRNAEVSAAMGMDPGLVARWSDRHQSGLTRQAEASDWSGSLKALAKFVRQGLQIAMLGVGAFLVLQQQITPGIMIAASIIMGRALAPVEGAIGSWRQVVQARDAYRRLDAFLKDPVKPAPDVPLPRPKGTVRVSQVVAGPPGAQKPVLRNVSFALAPGEALGVIGPSASGKTTLARCLMGVWTPAHGEIRLDGANVAEWDKRDLGPYLGYLPQDVELFEGTVAENIARFGAPDSDAVIKAAQLAGCHDMILALERNYATEIGADGSVLSAGQRQRLGLARAIYKQPAFVVLDEPNANLDGEGEEALRLSLKALKGIGTTVVIIAHRPSILKSVDTLLVLRNGTVDKFGPRDEVMAQVTRPVAQNAIVQAPGKKQEVAR